MGTDLPEPVRLTMIKGKNRTQEDNAIKYKGVYYLSLPVIHFFSKKQVASVTVAFGQEDIKSMLGAIAMKNIALIAAVLFSAMGLLFIYLRSLSLAPNTSKKALGQIKIQNRCGFFHCYLPVPNHLEPVQFCLNSGAILWMRLPKALSMSKLLKQDIEYLLAKGLNIRRLIKMDQKLADIIAVSPELDGITISDDKSKPLYIATRTQHGMCNRTNAKKIKAQTAKRCFEKRPAIYRHPEPVRHTEIKNRCIGRQADHPYFKTIFIQ